jgi:hypothetical protein
MTRHFGCFAVLGSLVAFGCSGEPTGTSVAPGPSPTSTGTGIPAGERPPGSVPVTVTQSSATMGEIASVKQSLAEVENLDADGFKTRYGTAHVASLGYDPKTASGLDKIAASPLAPTTAELGILEKNGFVISEEHRFPTFTNGYEVIYSAHLPLYVSADSILDAVHRSYDNILARTETLVLIPELRVLLQGLRTKLGAATAISAEARRDVDFYLAVALSLLDDGKVASSVAGGSQSDIGSFVTKAKAADGAQDLTLFGVPRHVDLSQFTPRGHYTDSAELSAYFRAMMWLGRIDFRIIETNEDDGTQVFNRRQFDAMLAIASLFDTANVERHRAIDDVIRAFVGESDNMQVKDVASLLASLGAEPGAVTVNASDEQIAQAILDGGFGAQRIASQIMISGVAGTLPLDRSFLIYGQRYVLDSHVFSNVVYDRVKDGAVKRMMPNPLDAAFAALGNDDAGVLLAPELQKFDYASDLASMRVLADQHGEAYWAENLYNLWLSSLRGLSPDGTGSDPAAAGMPVVTGTEPWGRRILNTQLASWAELRHDTILYVKQSYTGGVSCEFPDAYVDPYPEFYGALKRFADYAATNIVPVASRSPFPGFQTELADYFQKLGTVMQTLSEMATSERSGAPFTAAQMAFINDAVTIQNVCGGGTADGWYPGLVFGNPLDFDPTIADVHTQPTDEGGSPVGRVLHVGTGYTRAMIVTANTCTGPRAYAGVASSYFEHVTEQYDRLTDERWKDGLNQATPPDVPWMTDIVAR